MKRLTLNGCWKLIKCGTDITYPAKIPGSVLSSLLESKVIADPYDRMNEYQTRDLFWNDYMFERTFQVNAAFLQYKHIELVCEGLDTLTEIVINGEKVACTDNMHRTYHFPVRSHLRQGDNTISIKCSSVLKFIENYQYGENKAVSYTPCGAMYGSHLLRKPHSMFGWDWGPQLIDAGIFRDIYLQSWNEVKLDEIEFHQFHEAGKVHLQTKVTLSKYLPVQYDYFLKMELKEKETQKHVACYHYHFCENGQQKWTCNIMFEIGQPRLWWPNGYGKQPLYEMEIMLSTKKDGTEECLEVQHKTIGLRTLTINRERDEWGREFAFQVNGVKIFAMGGNYIPEDCIYSWITRERQEYLLNSMKRAHFNCVRVWGGGYYPSDEFYEMCDEKGLIVWQDLMYACNVYDATDTFLENCRQEVIDNLKRLRHHPCLGLICGNNEIESAWCYWGEFQTQSAYLRADYIKLFEHILPKAVRETAPDVFFWPSSPSSGGCFDRPGDENDGDAHYWDVWHGQKPFTDYQKYFFRFCSEFGFQSFPGKKTVDSFAREEDKNIFSQVMESHQKNNAANGKILYYLSENFRYPNQFEHLLYVSQILQGIAIKYGVEHWRRHRGRCMGTLYWQVNDNWPVASWASIDYFGRWKVLHYMAEQFYAPVACSMVIKENQVQLFVENETAQTQKQKVTIFLKDMKCKVIASCSADVEVEAFTSSQVLMLDLNCVPKYVESKTHSHQTGSWEEQVFLEGVLKRENGEIRRTVETLLPYKYLSLPKAKIMVTAREIEDAYVIQLRSFCFAAFVELDFIDADVIFNENYFHLTDTELYQVTVRKSDIQRGTFSDVNDLLNRLEVKSLVDTY